MMGARVKYLKPICLALAFSVLTDEPIAARDGENAGPANVYGTTYRQMGLCGSYPKVSAETPKWACVGLVAGPEQGMKMPREVLPLDDGSVLVTDMVGWKRPGKLWRLSRDPSGKLIASAIFEDLKHPSGLRMGPDGRVYVGEEHRIWHFDPSDAKLKKTVIVKGLPGKIRPGKTDHWHPITHFIFDLDGNIILNLGSYDDRCERRGRGGRRHPLPCPSDSARNMEAGLWKITRDKASGTWSAPKRFATGLRNSIAIAIHPGTGTLLQAENNVDRWAGTIRSRTNPPEEFNIVREGKHYGWPYCIGQNRVLPEYQGRIRCRPGRYEPPIALLPAHSSPYGMEYYEGAMFPELKGTLILALHSWQPNGHRIAMFDVDKRGYPQKPAGQRIDNYLLKNWTAQKNIRPAGRPGGLMVDKKGAIWFTDYKNHTLMVILRSDATR